MNTHITLTNNELCAVIGGDSAATIFGEQLAADGLAHANSSNPVVATAGIFVASAGGWIWAAGSFYDGLAGMFG